MRNDAMASAYLLQASARLKSAKSALRNKNYPYTVRQAQECVELSLKGVLRLYGIEYPKENDVKEVLLRVSGKFPRWFRKQMEDFARISSKLAAERGPSMYGDEEKDVPASELFGKDRAVEALKQAQLIYPNCSKALDAYLAKVKGQTK